MTKITKWLSLLMAGLLLSATLFACDNGGGWTGDDDEDDDDKNAQSESFDEYKGLSPEEVWDALLEAKEFTFTTNVSIETEDASQTVNSLLHRDGDKMMLNVESVNAAGDKHSELAYCDFKNSYAYLQGENGEWTVEVEEIELEDIFGDAAPVELIFEDSNYGEYDSETRSYTLTEEALQKSIGDGEEIISSGSMTRKGTVYTFAVHVEAGEQTQDVEVVVEFKSVTVELPEAKLPESGNQGESAVDTTAPENENTPAVTDKVPEVTQAPEVPDTPVVKQPDSPEEVLKNLKREDSAQLILYSLCPGVSEDSLLIEKNGDILRVTIATKTANMMSYMDTASGYLYTTLDNGVWVKTKSDSVFTWDTLLEQLTDPSMAFIFDDDSYEEYDASALTYTVRSAVLADASAAHDTDIQRAYMEYVADGIYCYYVDEYDADLDAMIYTEIEVDYADLDFKLPEAIEIESGEDEGNTNVGSGTDTPKQDPERYVGMNPNDIYKALLSAEEVGITAQVGTDIAMYQKSGDILRMTLYAGNSDEYQTVYIDLSTHTLYQQNGGDWLTQDVAEPFTWKELLDSMNLTSSTYFLNDRYYKDADANADTLEIETGVLAGTNILYGYFRRDGKTYSYEEVSSSNVTSIISFNFDAMNVELPV